VWNSADLEVLNTLNMFKDYIIDIKIFSDNQTLIACSDDNTVKLVDFENKKVVQSLQDHQSYVKKLYLCKSE
jgi:WD40 repeat protein